jgi:hypothetical protein
MQSGFLKRATYTLPATAGVETNGNHWFVIAYAPEMNLDFSDIRFYDSDDLTLVKHDRFSYTSGVTATFCVKVPSKLAAGQPIYVYYGAPALTDVSDPDNVYLLWDNFVGADGSALNASKWTLSSTNIKIYSNRVRFPLDANYGLWSNTAWDGNSILVGMIARVFDEKSTKEPARTLGFASSTYNGFSSYYRYPSISEGSFRKTGGANTGEIGSIYNSWHDIEIRRLSLTRDKFYFDGVEVGDITGSSQGLCNVFFRANTSSSPTLKYLWVEYVYVFKLPSDGTEVPDLAVPDLVEEILTEPEISVFKSGSELESGDYIDFGSRYADSDTDISLDINNNGGSQLEITTPVLISGDNLDQFSVNQQPSSPVAPLGSTITIIRFNPNSFGAKVAAVNIINSDPDKTPFLLYLMGYCIRPEFKKFTNRTGRIRIYDGSPTPYYLEMKFDVGNFTGPIGYNDTEELLQLHRGRLDGVQHYIEGDHRRVFDPLEIVFGLIFEKNFAFNILDLLINNSVEGVNLVSTKATSLRKDLSTIEFSSSSYKTFDVAILWTTNNLQGESLGYLYREVGFFDPSNQKISESEDEIKFDLSGKWYGSVQRITSFPVGVSL